MEELFGLVPIGFVRSAVRTLAEAPRQGRDSGTIAEVEVWPAYEEGLLGLEKRREVLVVCWMHLASRQGLRLRPRGDPGAPLAGVFATRSPNRPNPLAIYTAELLGVEGRVLRLRGVDAVDGTPVVDLRPRVPRLDG